MGDGAALAAAAYRQLIHAHHRQGDRKPPAVHQPPVDAACKVIPDNTNGTTAVSSKTKHPPPQRPLIRLPFPAALLPEALLPAQLALPAPSCQPR